MGLVTPTEPVPLGELGRVHFAAIGGAGMSGVARIMLARGVPVSGCDSAASAQLDELAALGAKVCVGHASEHLDSADTLVVSSAIRPDNPELARAGRIGMRVLHRAAALASVMAGRQSVAVAGTHGKTTTTSMITTVLRRCGADPAYVIGGLLAETGLGAAEGGGSYFVAEADESDGSFLMLAPDIAIITSVEADHLDNYGSLGEIEAAFESFAARIVPGGVLITSADDAGAIKVADAVRKRAGLAAAPRIVTYGVSAGSDYLVAGITPAGMATEFDLTPTGAGALAGSGALAGGGAAAGGGALAGRDAVRLRVEVPGRHNALNAAAAYATAAELGFAAPDIAAGLAAYRGAMRRMELKGEADGVRVLDSYAHHPTEITADLTAARDIAAGGRVIVIFQPHLFSRTRFFASQFGAALGQADEVFVLDIYAAREDPEPGVTGALVADAVPGGRAVFRADQGGLAAAIADIAKPGDIVLTMGAGDVTRLGPALLDALRGRAEGGG
jgi:UDP-N-acetylmuramate--alanine ligase